MTKIQITDSNDKKKAAKKSIAPKKVKKITVEKVGASSKKAAKKAMGKVAIKATPKKKSSSASRKSTDINKPSAKAPKIIKISDSKEEKVAKKATKKSAKETRAKTSAPDKAAEKSISSADTHSFLQKSTTLSRRYVKHPDETPASKAATKIEAAAEAKSEAKSETKATTEPATVEAESTATPVKVETQVETKSEAASAPETNTTTVPITTESQSDVKPETAETTAKVEIVEATEAAKAVEAVVAEAKPAESATNTPEATTEISITKTDAPKEPAVKISPKLAKKQQRAEAKAARKATAEAVKAAKAAKKQARANSMPSMKVSFPHRTKADDRVLRSAMRKTATLEDSDMMQGKFHKKRRGGRIVLALLCSGITVGALFAFVHFNMPDITVKVAAMQTGIEAVYPDIIPRGYTLSNVSSDKDGEIIMYFENSEGGKFSLSEEKSTWDSTALLNNYVKKAMSGDYSTIREQGITIYAEKDQAVWVNGGLFFTVKSTSGKWLTKEQIRNLATSM